jgi:hypothetical protein
MFISCVLVHVRWRSRGRKGLEVVEDAVEEDATHLDVGSWRVAAVVLRACTRTHAHTPKRTHMLLLLRDTITVIIITDRLGWCRCAKRLQNKTHARTHTHTYTILLWDTNIVIIITNGSGQCYRTPLLCSETHAHIYYHHNILLFLLSLSLQ